MFIKPEHAQFFLQWYIVVGSDVNYEFNTVDIKSF